MPFSGDGLTTIVIPSDGGSLRTALATLGGSTLAHSPPYSLRSLRLRCSGGRGRSFCSGREGSSYLAAHATLAGDRSRSGSLDPPCGRHKAARARPLCIAGLLALVVQGSACSLAYGLQTGSKPTGSRWKVSLPSGSCLRAPIGKFRSHPVPAYGLPLESFTPILDGGSPAPETPAPRYARGYCLGCSASGSFASSALPPAE